MQLVRRRDQLAGREEVRTEGSQSLSLYLVCRAAVKDKGPRFMHTSMGHGETIVQGSDRLT